MWNDAWNTHRLDSPVDRYAGGVSESFVPGLGYPSPAHQLWALILECMTSCEERVSSAAAEVGLSSVPALTLVRLDPEVPISQKELAARLGCSPSTVVDPADRLEERGLVVRQTHRDDRRIKVLVVTPEGRRVRDQLIARLFDPPAALRRLDDAETTRFRDAMLDVVASTIEK